MNYDEFKDHFNILTDSRQDRKITYDFFEVMFQVVTAMLCGMKTWDEIEAFGEENLEWFRKFSPYLSGIPSQDTTARIVGQGKIMKPPYGIRDDVKSYFH